MGGEAYIYSGGSTIKKHVNQNDYTLHHSISTPFHEGFSSVTAFTATYYEVVLPGTVEGLSQLGPPFLLSSMKSLFSDEGKQNYRSRSYAFQYELSCQFKDSHYIV